MTHKVITVLLVLVGLVNVAPVIGLASAEQLASMYGIAVADNNLEILLRHRALMFGLLGGLIFYSAFKAAWQPAVMSLALVSMAGFVLLAWSTGDYNEQLSGVIKIDIVALLLLFLAIGLRAAPSRRNAAN